MDNSSPNSPKTAITPNGLSAVTARSIPATPEAKSERTAITPGLAIEFSATERTAKSPREQPPVKEDTINALRAGNLFGRSKDVLKEAPLNEAEVAVTPTKPAATAVEPVTPTATPRTAVSTRTTPQTAMSCGRSLRTPSSAPKTALSKTPLRRALGTTTPKTALTPTPLKTATPGTRLNTATPGTATAVTPGTKRPLVSSKSLFRTPQMNTAVSGGTPTPGRTLHTAITPNGLSCKTAKTLRTPMTGGGGGGVGSASTKTAKVPRTPAVTAVAPVTPQTPKIKTANTGSCKTTKVVRTTPVTSGQKRARRSLFPNLKTGEPSSRSGQKSSAKKKNSKRSPSRSTASVRSGESVATGRSFQPPGTPHTCHEIEPRVLAEQKSEQQKIILTSSTPDGQFNVEFRIKMKVVGGGSEPQAMVTKKIVVNGEERYSSRDPLSFITHSAKRHLFLVESSSSMANQTTNSPLQEGFLRVATTTQEIIDKTWICIKRYNEQNPHPRYFLPVRIIEAYKKEDGQKRSYKFVVITGESTAKKAEVAVEDFNFYTAWIQEPDPERLLCHFELVEEGDETGTVTTGHCRPVEDDERFP